MPLLAAIDYDTGDPRFFKVLSEMASLHARKAADYGQGEDPLANLRAAAEFGLPAWLGVLVRMNDKMHRLKAFASKRTLANESVVDSLRDIACYAILAEILLQEEVEQKGTL